MLRGRARQGGSAALVRHRRGRPPKLTGRQVAQAQVWAGSGWTQQAIADHLKVARSVISELLARVGPAPVQDALTPTGDTDIESESPETVAGPDATIAATSDIEPTAPEPVVTEPVVTEPVVTEPVVTEPVVTEPVVTEPVVAGFTGTPVGSARAMAGGYRCRYAGAMLLYPYLHQVGAEDVFATLTGAPARRYNDLAVLTTATVGFALGVDTVEGTKHLRRAGRGGRTGCGPAAGDATGTVVRTGRRVRPVVAAAGLRRRNAGGCPGARPGLLRRRPLRGLQRCPAGRQGLEHQTPPRPPRPRRHATGRRPRPGSGLRHRRADRPGIHPARRPDPATAGPVPGPAHHVGLRPRRGVPGRVHRLPRRRRGLGHLPAGTAGGGHRGAATVLDPTRWAAGGRAAGRRDRPAPPVRPGPPAHPVRGRRTCPAGTDQRHQCHRRGRRARHRAARAAPAPGRAGHPETEERRATSGTPPDRGRNRSAGRRQDRAAPHTGQGPGHDAGPGREACPPTPAAPRLADGVATARVQRRSLARRALQRLPGRPGRVPGHPPQPATPRRTGRVHHQDHHRHPRPPRQPASRPGNAASHRRAQRHTSEHPRGPPPTDLPARRGINLNRMLIPT